MATPTKSVKTERSQKMIPSGRAIRSSSGDGWLLRWNDRTMATATTAIVTERRRYERKAEMLVRKAMSEGK